MPVEPGQTPLHHRVVEKIFEGGMGEVWRAEDTSPGRDVAIKVRPFPDLDARERLVSSDDGFDARWSAEVSRAVGSGVD